MHDDDARRYASGAVCPECSQGRMFTRTTKRVGENTAVRFTRCSRCGERGKHVIPLSAIRRRAL